jgi:hypothetical protein
MILSLAVAGGFEIMGRSRKARGPRIDFSTTKTTQLTQKTVSS